MNLKPEIAKWLAKLQTANDKGGKLTNDFFSSKTSTKYCSHNTFVFGKLQRIPSSALD